jgi:sugar phosphate isomerase/epimerase
VADRVHAGTVGTVLGTTLFSLTPLWRFGADPVTMLERVAEAGCGPAIEVVGHQAWRGFPALSTQDERAFRDAVDRLGLRPVALGIYTDLYRRPGRPLTEDEAFDEVRPQLQAAARLGFGVVRATLGMAPGLMRRILEEAERHGITLTFEVQGTTAPDSPAVLDVLALKQETGSHRLGFTVDFSLSTPALPAAFGVALRRLGIPGHAVADVHRAWESDGSIGAALAAVSGHSDDPAVTTLVAGVIGRCGRTRPGDWAHVLPAVHHAHAKFWDPAVESVRAPHGAWLSALAAAGYSGAVVSEWGGHELLARADADPLAITRTHLALLAELAGASSENKASENRAGAAVTA